MKTRTWVFLWIGCLCWGAGLAEFQVHQIQSGELQLEPWGAPVVSPNGRWALVANPPRNQVARVDLLTLGLDFLQAGDRPEALAITPDGVLLAAANVGQVPFGGDTVSVFNLSTGGPDAIATYQANANLDHYNNIAFTPDSRFAFLASRHDGYLHAFNPWSGERLQLLYLGFQPTVAVVSPDSRRLAVVTRLNGFLVVKVFDLVRFYEDHSFVELFSLSTSSTAQEATNVVFSADGSTLYVPAFTRNLILAFSMRDGAAAGEYPTGSGPVNLAMDGDLRILYAVNVLNNSITRLDLATGSASTRTYTGAVFDPLNNVCPIPGAAAALVGSRSQKRVLQIDARTGDLLYTYATADGPCAVAANASGSAALVPDQMANRLEVFLAERRYDLVRAEAGAGTNLGFSFLNPHPFILSEVGLTPYRDSGNPAAPELTLPLAESSQLVRQWTATPLPVPFEGWLKASTPQVDVKSFTMYYRDDLGWMDGYVLGGTPLCRLVFPYVNLADAALCAVHLVNPNDRPNFVSLRLLRNTGYPLSTSFVLAAHSRRVLDDLGSLFNTASQDTGCLLVEAEVPLFGLAEFGTEQSRACLPALAAGPAGERIVLCHTAEGAGWLCGVVISNPTPEAAALEARYYAENGLLLADRILTVEPERQWVAPVRTLFELDPASELRTGWIELTGDTGLVHAAVVFETEDGAMMAALPGQRVPQAEIFFAHIAQDAQYFTGFAVVNDSGEPTPVLVEIFSENGQLLRTYTLLELPDRHKFVRLLSDPVFGLNQQLGGYIKITSNRPLFSYSLFGIGGSFLSAIPPQ